MNFASVCLAIYDEIKNTTTILNVYTESLSDIAISIRTLSGEIRDFGLTCNQMSIDISKLVHDHMIVVRSDTAKVVSIADNANIIMDSNVMHSSNTMPPGVICSQSIAAGVHTLRERSRRTEHSDGIYRPG